MKQVVGMLVVETIARIRREHFIKGKTIKEIARDLKVSRNTVRKVLRSGETSFEYVFQATGAVWVYSPCGRREWRYLNDSSIKLSGLAFGDFDGDGKTDVFSQEGSQWLVFSGGTGPWTPLPAGSNIPMSGYGF